MKTRNLSLVLALGLPALGCQAASEIGMQANPKPQTYELPGVYPVGNRSVVLSDESRGRSLRVEFWYPAQESARSAAEAGQSVIHFMHDVTQQAAYEALLADAPAVNGPSRTAFSALDAPLAEDESKWPLVVFSHCYNCTRFSVFSIAERLASHGIAVAAPDHTGGTLFEHLAGTAAALGPEFLDVRAADLQLVLDQALSGDQLPVALQGKFDANAVGIFGHSFGGATAGRMLMLDKRPKAGLALAVPMDSELLPGVDIQKLTVPLFFVVAVEDNSITEIGNKFIRDNYAEAPGPVWKLEMKDTGHWSFTDICGIDKAFSAGCVHEDRQSRPGEYFDYIPGETAREIAGAYVTAFFSATLREDQEAKAYLTSGRPAEWVTVESR